MQSFDKKSQKTEYIRVGDISVVWAQAQRPLDPNWVEHIGVHFDPDKFDRITVTLPNGDGQYHCVDGQHRLEYIRESWGSDQKVPCRVVDCHDPQEAAELFLGLNDQKRVTPIDKFLAAVTAGRPEESEINSVVHSVGYEVSPVKSQGHIAAVNALRHVYNRMGPGGLQETLRTIQRIWSMDTVAVDQVVIKAVAILLRDYGDELDYGRFIDVMRRQYPNGAAFKHGQDGFKTFCLQTGWSAVDGALFCMKQTYNKRLAKKKHLS